jgi:dCTP deaminase
MILPDHEIKKLIKEGEIGIEPLDDPENQIQPAWVDLRLGKEFVVFKVTATPYIDPRSETENYTENVTLEDDKPFIVHPGEFVLGKVMEYIKLPDNLVGSVDGRSSLGRLGRVVHTTSSSVNPGWEGHLVLEMANVGKMPVALYPGMRVCKIAFHKMTSSAEVPYNMRKSSKYNLQKDIIKSRMHEDGKS